MRKDCGAALDMVDGVATRNRQMQSHRHLNLSARELEVVMLMVKGMVAKEIAQSLALSEKTVRNHIGSIYRKLGVYDRVQVVIYALKAGLVDVLSL